MSVANTVPARFSERASLHAIGGLKDRTALRVEGKKRVPELHRLHELYRVCRLYELHPLYKVWPLWYAWY